MYGETTKLAGRDSCADDLKPLQDRVLNTRCCAKYKRSNRVAKVEGCCVGEAEGNRFQNPDLTVEKTEFNQRVQTTRRCPHLCLGQGKRGLISGAWRPGYWREVLPPASSVCTSGRSKLALVCLPTAIPISRPLDRALSVAFSTYICS